MLVHLRPEEMGYQGSSRTAQLMGHQTDDGEERKWAARYGKRRLTGERQTLDMNW